MVGFRDGAPVSDGLALGDWLGDIHDVDHSYPSRAVPPLPFMRHIEAGSHGGVYELRSYLLKPGTTQETIDLWAEAAS